MKKKIFLALALSIMLVCLFAICVCADDAATEDPYAVYYDDVYVALDGTSLPLYEKEGDAYYALAWFYDSEADEYESFRMESEVVFWYAPNANKPDEVTPIPANADFRETAFPVFTDETKTYTMANLVLVNLHQSKINKFSGTWQGLPIEAIYCNNDFSYINGGTFNNTEIVVFDIPKTHNRTSGTICAAFANTNLKEIYIPKYVCLLGSAFSGLKTLEKVEFAAEYAPVGHISWQTTQDKTSWFKDCTSLKTVILPTTSSTQTYIGTNTFANCSSLEEIVIPPVFTSINQAAFEKCTALKSIVIPEGVTTLGNCAFKGCSNLASVTFPSTLTTISGDEHFWNTNLSTVIGLEKTQITRISKYMFKGLKNWKPETLILPNTVESIGENGLADIGMKNLVLGAGLKTMAGGAITGCSSLVSIYVPAGLDTLYLSNSSAKYVFVVSSNEDVAGAFKTDAGFTTNLVKYSDYEENEAAYANDKYIIYECNVCEAFYNSKHKTAPIEGNPCLGECSVCKEQAIREDAAHVYAWIFNDGNNVSLLAQITAKHTCQYCQTVVDSTDIPAIFENYGSSSSMTGVGVHQKTKVNEKALERYAKLTGNENVYNYGIFAGVAVDRDGTVYDGDLVAVNGTAVSATNPEKSVVASFANTDYTILTIKITGVAANDQIYFGTFATVGNNVTYVTGNTEGNKAEAQTIV